MHHLPFASPGSFFRGNLHTHSTRSDGACTPAKVVADYRARGYDFISLTDHFLPNAHFRPAEEGFIDVSDTREFHTDEFVTVLGAELHGPTMENGELWHFVAVGLPAGFEPPREGESGPEIARRAREQGAWVALAHPYWNGVSDADALGVADIIHAVETYNHASEVGTLRGHGLHQAEVMLGKGHRVQLCATDDAHFRHPRGTFTDAFGGWVQVKAESLCPDALLAALKAGRFYSSTGPEIHDIALDDGRIRVACSPARDIIVSGRGAIYRRGHDTSIVEFETELPDPERSPYVRVTVVDQFGRAAWSNPIWLDA